MKRHASKNDVPDMSNGKLTLQKMKRHKHKSKVSDTLNNEVFIDSTIPVGDI